MTDEQLEMLRSVQPIILTPDVNPVMVTIPKAEYDLLIEIKNTFLGGKP